MKRGLSTPADLRAPWQIENAKRCGCGGQDDMCPCQNDPDCFLSPKVGLDYWRSRAEQAEAACATYKAEVERLKMHVKDSFNQMRKWMDASYHLQYPVSPELLEAAAERIDCGGDCETSWREWDTNAAGCTQSETAEGCSFEMAADLRDFAKALRTQATEAEAHATLAASTNTAPGEQH